MSRQHVHAPVVRTCARPSYSSLVQATNVAANTGVVTQFEFVASERRRSNDFPTGVLERRGNLLIDDRQWAADLNRFLEKFPALPGV